MTEPRLIMKALVSEDHVAMCGDYGSQTFREAYIKAAAWDRYMITQPAEQLPGLPDDYWVIDLWESHINVENGRVKMGSVRTFPTFDAALAATRLNFEQGFVTEPEVWTMLLAHGYPLRGE